MKINNYSLILASLKLVLLTTTSQALSYSFGGDDILELTSRGLGFDSPGEHYTRELYASDISNISTRDLVEELERRVGPGKQGSSPPSTGPGSTANAGADSTSFIDSTVDAGTGNTAKTGAGSTANAGVGNTGAAGKKHINHKPPLPQTAESLNEALRRLKSGKGPQTDKKKEQEKNLREKIHGMGGVPYDEAAAPAGGAGGAGGASGASGVGGAGAGAAGGAGPAGGTGGGKMNKTPGTS